MNQNIFRKSFFYFGSFIACGVMALSTGCASGGFKLTRQYASWVNSQNIILRIVLYILTFVVFAVTLIIDAVVFNTMDFWDGKVSQGTYNFKKGDTTYQVRHELLPGQLLRCSTIHIMDKNHKLLQEIVLKETPNNEIEMSIDGQVRTRVRNISSLPIAAIFDKNGKLMEEKNLLFEMPKASSKVVAQQ